MVDRAAGRCKVCRSPWLWTGVGAAVVLGTVLTIVATSSSTAAADRHRRGDDFVRAR